MLRSQGILLHSSSTIGWLKISDAFYLVGQTLPLVKNPIGKKGCSRIVYKGFFHDGRERILAQFLVYHGSMQVEGAHHGFHI